MSPTQKKETGPSISADLGTLRQPLASSHALISNRVTESVRTERLKFLKKRPLLIRGAFSLIK